MAFLVLIFVRGRKSQVQIGHLVLHSQAPLPLQGPDRLDVRLVPLGRILLEVDHDVRRIALPHHILHADHQGGGGGHHHQHHGGQDADIGEPHGILLHAVDHPGHADKMPCPVIIFPVFPQDLQKGDAPGGEEQIGPDDDQHHCHEEQQQGRHRVTDRDGDIISAAYRDQPRQSQKPSGGRLFLPRVPGLQQGDGIRHMDLPDGVDADQEENHREYLHCLPDDPCGYEKA